MQNTSPFLAIQQVEVQIKTLLRHVDLRGLGEESRKAVVELRQNALDTRLDIRDYELSETREEQLKNALVAKKRLASMQVNILAASDIFNAVDTAQITAQIEQIKDWLQ